jgi:hypothetical protein
MSHENASALPTIPFTEYDMDGMRSEDVNSGKTIALLTCGIFVIGLVLYTCVLVAVATQTLVYTSR